MTRPMMKSLLLNNWGAKLASLAVALTIWAVIKKTVETNSAPRLRTIIERTIPEEVEPAPEAPKTSKSSVKSTPSNESPNDSSSKKKNLRN